jgi:hypothetical protein
MRIDFGIQTEPLTGRALTYGASDLFKLARIKMLMFQVHQAVVNSTWFSKICLISVKTDCISL